MDRKDPDYRQMTRPTVKTRRFISYPTWYIARQLSCSVRLGVVITNKSQTQTQDGVLWSISISDSGIVIIKILGLFSNSGLSLKLRNPEIGLYLAQKLYSR